MAIPLGILMGIVAMLCWGATDFFAAKAVRKSDVHKTLMWSQIAAVAAFIPVLYFFFDVPLISLSSIGIILITGFLSVAAYLAYYKGLQIGKVSVVSPVTACWGAVTFVLSLTFLNESVTMIQTLGVCLAVLGAVMVSFRFHDIIKVRIKSVMKGAELGAIAALGWGVYFVFIDVLVSELNWIIAIFLAKAVSMIYFLAYCGASKKGLAFPKNIAFLVVLIGLLETIGYMAYGYGITSEHTAIVAPIATAFPAVTVVLARIFFTESLELNQKLGIVSVLSGLVLLSL